MKKNNNDERKKLRNENRNLILLKLRYLVKQEKELMMVSFKEINIIS